MKSFSFGKPFPVIIIYAIIAACLANSVAYRHSLYLKMSDEYRSRTAVELKSSTQCGFGIYSRVYCGGA